MAIPIKQIYVKDITCKGNLPKADEVAVLANQIKANGLYHAIIVTKDSIYALEAGRRRLAAAKKLGWEKIPAVVLEWMPPSIRPAIVEVIEAVQRDQLNSHGLAKRLVALAEEGVRPSEMADLLGRARGSTCNLTRWYEAMPGEVRLDWHNEHPRLNHRVLEQLAKLDSKEKRIAEWARIKETPATSIPRRGTHKEVRPRAAQHEIAAIRQAIATAPVKEALKNILNELLDYIERKSDSIPLATMRQIPHIFRATT